jgi:hypothetical protein
MGFWTSWALDSAARKVVLFLLGLTMVDVVLTWTLISLYGVAGEANPLIGALFEVGLGYLWLPLNLILTTVGAVLLASIYVLATEKTKLTAALGLSLLAALKWLAALSHISFIYQSPTLWTASVISTGAIFLATYRLLAKGMLLDFGLWRRAASVFIDDLSTSIVTFNVSRIKHLMTNTRRSTGNAQPQVQLASTRTFNKRLLLWVAIIVLGPLIAFGLIDLIIALTGVNQLPRWLRALGIVEEAQGRAMLLIMVAVFVIVGVLVYAIVSVLDILAQADKG